MKLHDYLKKADKSQAELGESLGVTQSAVSQWIQVDLVPAKHCPKIERWTNGEVTCEEMNTEVDWAFVRKSKCVRSSKPRRR